MQMRTGIKSQQVVWESFPEILTLKQVSICFGWSRYEIINMIKSGKISAYRTAESHTGHWRIRKNSLKGLIEGNCKGDINNVSQ
jgi:hypothetical protein